MCHQASRLRCMPQVGMTGVLPWTLSQLLSRREQCRLATVDVPHLLADPASSSTASSGQSGMPSRLVYLRLAAVPQQWAIGGRLRALDVSDHSACAFSMPDSIAACSELRQLRLSIWQLQSLPASFGSLEHLQSLQLKKCRSLARLPSSFSQLQHLRHLDLAGCDALEQLPADIGSLQRLRSLDISSCVALQHLPDSIGSISTMEMLTMRDCTTLQQLPENISSLTHLKQLDVNGCTALAQLPDSMSSLLSLHTLFAGDCPALWRFPESIGQLPLLEYLHIGGCVALQQLPFSTGSLSSLETLFSFGLEALQQLPVSIGHLSSLVMLCIGNCPALRDLPPSIGSLGSLEKLDCSCCAVLQHLPSSIGGLSNLKELNISWCQALKKLPDTISQIHRLETLNISGCTTLQRLPDGIGSLSSLTTLDASHCMLLQQLPDSIGSLCTLRTMYIRNCPMFQRLPEGIGGLSNLVELDVSSCRALQHLPHSIGSLSYLRKLDVSNCTALQQLPDSISRWPSSQQLVITGAGDLAVGLLPPVSEQQLPSRQDADSFVAAFSHLSTAPPNVAALRPEQQADQPWLRTAGSVPVTPDLAANNVQAMPRWNSAEHCPAEVAGQLGANFEHSASSLQQWPPFAVVDADAQQSLAAPAPVHHAYQPRGWPQLQQPGNEYSLQHQQLPPPGVAAAHQYGGALQADRLQQHSWQQSESLEPPFHTPAPQPHWRQQVQQHTLQPHQYDQQLYQQAPHHFQQQASHYNPTPSPPCAWQKPAGGSRTYHRGSSCCQHATCSTTLAAIAAAGERWATTTR